MIQIQESDLAAFMFIRVLLLLLICSCSHEPKIDSYKKDPLLPRLPNTNIAIENFNTARPVRNLSWPDIENKNLFLAHKHNKKHTFPYQYNSKFATGASVALLDNTIFVLDNEGILTAYSIITGNKKWCNKEANNIKNNNLHYGGMLIYEKTIYMTTGTNVVLAINKDDGKNIWQQKINSPVRSKPVYDDNNIYIKTVDNNIYSINKNNGKVNWMNFANNSNTSIVNQSPLLLKDELIIVQENNGQILLINKNNGELAGDIRNKIIRNLNYVNNIYVPQPLIYQDKLMSFSNDGFMNIIDINKQEVINSFYTNFTSNVIVIEDICFGISTNDVVVAFDIKSEQIKWYYHLDVKKQWNSNIVILNGNLYLMDLHGNIVILNPKNGALVNNISLNIASINHPIVTLNGQAFIMTDKAILMHDL